MGSELLIQGRRGFTLRLTDDALTIRYVLRSSRFAWHEISGEFRPVWRYVGFDLTPEARRSSKARALYAWIQRTFFGFDAAIDPVPYRTGQDELLRLLNQNRGARARAS